MLQTIEDLVGGLRGVLQRSEPLQVTARISPPVVDVSGAYHERVGRGHGRTVGACRPGRLDGRSAGRYSSGGYHGKPDNDAGERLVITVRADLSAAPFQCLTEHVEPLDADLAAGACGRPHHPHSLPAPAAAPSQPIRNSPPKRALRHGRSFSQAVGDHRVGIIRQRC